ncbi:hypothetical protein [Colwellia psychrerythraea]|uniref:Uncharacterized protein n=1 Tax=Colwellia psychrerythraea TaxID=28229 RepID=A0A099KCJ9_COLPS|nr:hypothetical protein [Colwellia psychrerythraea]KGJ87757.1 hypothetical protein GAB14E_4435 [Colwellia psychrerythraea]
MMINSNYAQQVERAKNDNALIVNFENNSPAVQATPGEKDTLTLSDKALAMMSGNKIKEVVPIYVRPQTARALLAESEEINSKKTNVNKEQQVVDKGFSQIMQNILDQRLGVDRERLAELEAMMEEIGNNENMSSEEKAAALEKLAEMREKIIEESRDIREIVQQKD